MGSPNVSRWSLLQAGALVCVAAAARPSDCNSNGTDDAEDITLASPHHEPVLTIPGDPAPVKLYGLDLDLDGDQDLVAIYSATHNLTPHWSLGRRRFSEPGVVPAEVAPRSVQAADLDGASKEADANQDGVPDACVPGPNRRFVRGDANADGAIDIAYPIAILRHLLQGRTKSPCPSAADADDDDSVSLTDAVRILRRLFAGDGPLPDPQERCGLDPTIATLSCKEFSPCP